MKNRIKRIQYLLLVFFTISGFIYGQNTADLFIENASVSGAIYSFEVHITPTSDWGGGLNNPLGDCSWYFDFNESAMNNPQLTYVSTVVDPTAGYTNSVQIVAGTKIAITTVQDLGSGFGVALTQGTKYHVYTVELDITNSGLTSQLVWDETNTGIFNLLDAEIVESYNGSDNVALPVELTAFTAETTDNNKVLLNWETATEVDNYGFEIERASSREDGTTPVRTDSSPRTPSGAEGWTKIGFVEGHGNSNSPKEYSFTDTNPSRGAVQYRLKQIDTDGAFEYSDIIEVEIVLPTEYKLTPNYPNPFNPTTIIAYSIPENGNVKLRIYDTLGRLVTELINKEMEAGVYEQTWDASQYSSGVYIYMLSVNGNRFVKKMNLVK
ncbi:MAG: T9SS type A sorting domain-containing protein [Melioribacteraceae bacterium]|nr:T9SS type A sorting domain-containing protein [Melioribacteraceae bacterium]